MAEAHTSYLPTDGLCYDPGEPRYFDERGLGRELARAFEVCHGCRLCFKYCEAFPHLFRLVDELGEDRADKLAEDHAGEVAARCFQCRLCEVQCPYTPRDGHPFQLDFPRLLQRYTIVRRRGRRPGLRERLLADPDLAGRLARLSFGLADRFHRFAWFRRLLEATVGIDRRKLLPPFARRSFTSLARRRGLLRPPGAAAAVLFPTCYVEHNEPKLGFDALEVLARAGVETACTAGLVCCGMPALERGDLDGVRRKAKRNLEALLPYVDRGAAVLAVNPTCSLMLRRELPELLTGAERARARRLAASVRDPGEHLWGLRKEVDFRALVRSRPEGPVAYHAPCHLRAQGVGFRGRDLIRHALGVEVRSVLECSGHDGTYALRVEGYEASVRVGRKAFDGLEATGAGVWVSDCPLAALQFEQHAGRKPLHPLALLARAFRGEPFPAPGGRGAHDAAGGEGGKR